jgi:hypothetical protein
MAERDSEGGGSSPISLNGLLALVTLAGGVWLVSHKLTSDRPVTPAGGPREFVGEQNVEARLWEDPFKSANPEGKAAPTEQTETNLNLFIDQIRERSEATDHVLLLPVMLSSGQYSEDQESRRRSRFAIVSALGRSGYAPEDAEHIGELTIPWPTQHEVDKAKRNPETTLKKLWETNTPLGRASSHMALRYEWYRPRSFFPHPSNDLQTNVLVLWVDDSFFADEPLLRLPLLLEPMIDPGRLQQSNIPDVALIGPRSSTTLRAMLPGPLAGTAPLWDTNKVTNTKLWPLASNILQHIAICSATPSAMDEVLVTNAAAIPRQAVRNALTNNGFKSFQNFAATDAQLAREVLDELTLSGTDLADTNNHVVLISEWDTFYARVLSLTYAAELDMRQMTSTSYYDFVHGYVEGTKRMPQNLHSFVYLRGLDGQTVKGDAGADASGGDSEHAAKSSPSSVEEIRNWTPDANKAEGRAQLDYLSRLGGQLTYLETNLRRRGRGHIEAIGIVGSDVYDTLLILQALRPKFPDAVFFTTDLDARFYSPREREWTRDLLVVSGYGLALHSRLQHDIAPFRDSAQTAQFAAALTALGDTNLAKLVSVPPRRFEISSGAVLDLSVTNILLAGTNRWLHPMTVSETYQSDLRHHRIHYLRRLVVAMVIMLVLAAACMIWDPLRHLTVEAFQFPCEALDYSKEDIGGPDGAEALLKQFRASPNTAFKWMKELPDRFRAARPPSPARLGVKGDSRQPPSAMDAYYERLLEKERTTEETAARLKAEREQEEHLDEQAGAFVALLNQTLKRKDFPPEADAEAPKQVSRIASWEQIRPWIFPAACWRAMRPMRERYRVRRLLDACLDRLAAPQLAAADNRKDIEAAVICAAADARMSAREIFRLRCERLVCLWAVAILFGGLAVGLGCAIWSDTFWHPYGERFSLTNGGSEWPAEIVRLLVCACCVCFSFGLYYRMREAFFGLTRKFRLSFSPANDDPKQEGFLRRQAARLKNLLGAKRPKWRKIPGELFSVIKDTRRGLFFFKPTLTPESANHVCVLSVWQEYLNGGRPSQRMARVALPLMLYIGLCAAAFWFYDQDPFDRVRGSTLWMCNKLLVCGSGILFIVLGFLTVDAVRLCCRFILALSSAESDYPFATRRHFSRQLGNIRTEYLNEWIDIQLVADLTERVGRLVYYPTYLIFALLLARSGWWDSLSWPTGLILVYGFNLLLALASVLILQRAAQAAKREAEENMIVKVKALQARNAPTPEQNDADQAKQLLDEIRDLRRGAFAPFWENPVVGALFLSSGGTTALQVMIWFMSR